MYIYIDRYICAEEILRCMLTAWHMCGQRTGTEVLQVGTEVLQVGTRQIVM